MQNVINLFNVQTVRPISVVVEYSESNQFATGESYSFDKFESLAFKAAKECVNRGYLKTGIVITFDNGHQYQCRIDISSDSEAGFQDHCDQMIEYSTTEEGAHYYSQPQAKRLIEFVKTIQFDDNQVYKHRRSVLAKLTLGAREEEQRKQEEAQALRVLEREQQEAREKEFQDNLSIPEDAQAVIVAYFTEYDNDKSDPYGDYHTTKTNKTIILAWSKHKRDMFSEMRKAAKNHPDTEFLSDKENSTEHREKYSMGEGFYLTDNDYIRAGVKIKKVKFWKDENKAQQVPFGELVTNNAPKKKTSEPQPQEVKTVETIKQTKPAFKR